jgi:hypothetical protein
VWLSLKCGIRTADSADSADCLKCGSSGIDPKLRIFDENAEKFTKKNLEKIVYKADAEFYFLILNAEADSKFFAQKKICLKLSKMRTAELFFTNTRNM